MKKCLLALSFFFCWPVFSQPLVMGFQEGSGSSGEAQYATDKYGPFVDELGKFLKKDIKGVGLSPHNLFDAEKTKNVDILFTRVASVGGWAMDKLGFVSLATVNDPRAVVVVGAATRNYKALSDLKGTHLASPAVTSEPYRLFSMAMQRAGYAKDYVIYPVKLQGTIPFALENNLAEAGVVTDDSAVYTALTKDPKTRVLFKVGDLPPWIIVANSRLGEENIERLRIGLAAFANAPERRTILQNLRFGKLGAPNDAIYVQTFRTLYPELVR